MTEQPPLIVICGPTASGKSDQALNLAERLGSQSITVDLISADSRQIYRELDIGTAKPTPAQQARWPHHLIDIADPTERWTVARYQALAQALIQSAHQAGRIPLLVGGTGLYLQAAMGRLGIPTVPPDLKLRQQLETWPQSVRHQFLEQVDPATKIHPHDAIRTLRALEVYYVTGRSPSSQQTRPDPPYRVLTLGLTSDSTHLEQRIAQRTQTMLQSGWIPELQQLRHKYGADLPLLQTLGYAELGSYLDGKLAYQDLVPLITRHTRQFAKRQMTWFRKTPKIEWLDCQDPQLNQIIGRRVEAFLAG